MTHQTLTGTADPAWGSVFWWAPSGPTGAKASKQGSNFQKLVGMGPCAHLISAPAKLVRREYSNNDEKQDRARTTSVVPRTIYAEPDMVGGILYVATHVTHERLAQCGNINAAHAKKKKKVFICALWTENEESSCLIISSW